MRLVRIPLALSLSLALPATSLARQPLAVVAPAGDEQLSEREKLKKAKKLYVEAEGLAKEGKWAEAADLYEQAYYLVPGKHGFAYKVGLAAFEAGDCDRAQEYLIHFLTYGDHEKHQDKLDDAQHTLEEIDASGCATQKSDMKVDATGQPVDSEDPFSAGEGGQEEQDKGKGNKGLLIGGAVLLALGAGGIALGAAGTAMAMGTRNELEDLGGESPSTPTGYPSEYYACKSGAPCPSDLEGQLGTQKTLATVGFVAGGVLLAGGATLVTLWVLRRGKSGGQEARRGGGPRLTGLGPTWVPGGGGLGASLEF
jgi:hypothetical protein